MVYEGISASIIFGIAITVIILWWKKYPVLFSYTKEGQLKKSFEQKSQKPKLSKGSKILRVGLTTIIFAVLTYVMYMILLDLGIVPMPFLDTEKIAEMNVDDIPESSIIFFGMLMVSVFIGFIGIIISIVGAIFIIKNRNGPTLSS